MATGGTLEPECLTTLEQDRIFSSNVSRCEQNILRKILETPILNSEESAHVQYVIHWIRFML